MSRRLILVLVVAFAASAGCDTSNFAFKIDKSIEVVAPQARQEVSLPLTIRWTDSKPPTTLKLAPRDSDAGYYGVFLDAAPLGPGKTLRSLLPKSTVCDAAQGCPTADQLAEVGAYLTAKPELVLEFVADLRPTSRGESKDTHEVTIVRMRGDKRVAETAFRQTFFVRR